MMLTDLSKIKNRVVGIKQTLKVINDGIATKVFIADDIDKSLKNRIMQATSKQNVAVEIVESKLKLGRACNIDVSASCAALLK